MEERIPNAVLLPCQGSESVFMVRVIILQTQHGCNAWNLVFMRISG